MLMFGEKLLAFTTVLVLSKRHFIPNLYVHFCCLSQKSEKVLKIRSEITERSELLYDLRVRVSTYNKKQSSIADVHFHSSLYMQDEDLLKQLYSREEYIASYGEGHPEMVLQTKEQAQKVFVA